MKHLRPLYITAQINGKPVSRLLLDKRASINIVPLSTLKKLDRNETILIPTDVVITNFIGETTKPADIVSADIIIGGSMTMLTFFVMQTISNYNVLLGQDWIHANSCVPSSLHQLLIF